MQPARLHLSKTGIFQRLYHVPLLPIAGRQAKKFAKPQFFCKVCQKVCKTAIFKQSVSLFPQKTNREMSNRKKTVARSSQKIRCEIIAKNPSLGDGSNNSRFGYFEAKSGYGQVHIVAQKKKTDLGESSFCTKKGLVCIKMTEMRRFSFINHAACKAAPLKNGRFSTFVRCTTSPHHRVKGQKVRKTAIFLQSVPKSSQNRNYLVKCAIISAKPIARRPIVKRSQRRR